MHRSRISSLFRAAAMGLAMAALAGCQSVGETSAEQQVAAGCASASAAVKALTVAKQAGKLTAEADAAISASTRAITPICGATNPPTLDSVKLAAFLQAIALLQSHAAQLQESRP